MNRMMTAARFSTFVVSLTCGVLVSQASADWADWPYWVGPNYTGISPEKNLPAEWDPAGGEGSNLLWKAEIGVRSTPTLMNGRLYVLSTSYPEDHSRSGEKVVCLDAETGETLWEHKFNVYLSDVPIERVGWSSVVCDPDSGNVYALGVCGYFCCLNGETGELVWDRSLHEEFGLLSTYGGRTNFPIVHEGNVIVSAVVIGWGEKAKPAHRFIAFDKLNGQPVWFEGTRLLPHDTTYSAPVLASIDGELQMIFGSGDGAVHGFQPRTGKRLWTCNISSRGLNATPLVVGNRVYMGNGEENLGSNLMGSLTCIDPTVEGKMTDEGFRDLTEEGVVWRQMELFSGRSSPMMIDGRLYVADDRAKLHCLDPETGESLGEQVRMGTMMRANLLYADGKIYAHEVNGRGYVLEPTETGAEIIHRFRFRGEECHGSPIASNGRIFVPTTGAVYCVGLEDAEPQRDELPELPAEAELTDETPVHVQVVPVESLFRPGTRQRFLARLYNAEGQYLRDASAEELEFSIEGPGSIDENGAYVIPGDEQVHAPVFVSAKFNDLEGSARIRIVPDLDWSFDFDDGQVPPTWVGAAYRHIPLDWDLYTKLREEDETAGGLYIYLMTEFVNVGPNRVFDDTTPQLRWKQFLQYFGLDTGADRPKNVAEAQALFDASLQELTDEKVVGSFEWSTWDRKLPGSDDTVPEPRLTVTQGERWIDGNGVLCKVSTIPLGTRSQSWMGHPDLHDYTIQSDIYCLSRRNKLPDAGLIGQRYMLLMMGAAQQLQILTWTPQLERFSATVPFEWEAETWYTMKFRTEAQGDKAILRGKVWKRDEDEPSEWNIVAEDAMPNLIGSPGLRGTSSDGEIFYDNLSVRRNED
jgi:outer membrane protein assembly factor BamB